MNNIFNQILKGGMLGAVVLGGLASCTDDHFDVLDFGTSSGSTTQTMWEVIQQNEEYSDFKEILERTYLLRDEHHHVNLSQAHKLSELLNDPQTFTLWIPKNGSYAQEFLDTLDRADEYLQKANQETDEVKRDSIMDIFRSRQFQVASHLVYNHLARFNHEGKRERQEIMLLNGKKAYYDASAHSYNDLPIVSSLNTANGTMHTLETAYPYAFNIRDYIYTNQDVSKLRDVLATADEKVFNENASLNGAHALNNEGMMIYEDSVYSYTNRMINQCGAQLTNEDSCYIALLPSNKTWDESYSRMKSYFNYKESYSYMFDDILGTFKNTGTKAYSFTDRERDSLANLRVLTAMVQGAFFSPSRNNIVPEKFENDEDMLHRVITEDSLFATNNTLYYNPTWDGKSKDHEKEINPIFANTTPIKASNGYIYTVNDYQVKPEYVWMRRQEFLATADRFKATLPSASSHCESQTGTTIALDESSYNEEVSDPYKINEFCRYVRSGQSEMTVSYRLNDLLSGPYTIKAILVPSRISTNIKALLDKDENESECKVYAEVIDENGTPLELEMGADSKKKTQSIEFTIDQDAAKEYTLIEKINIENCYYQLPVQSFLRLRLTSPYTKKNKAKNGSGINIYKIFIEPYREPGEGQGEE